MRWYRSKVDVTASGFSRRCPAGSSVFPRRILTHSRRAEPPSSAHRPPMPPIGAHGADRSHTGPMPFAGAHREWLLSFCDTRNSVRQRHRKATAMLVTIWCVRAPSSNPAVPVFIRTARHGCRSPKGREPRPAPLLGGALVRCSFMWTARHFSGPAMLTTRTRSASPLSQGLRFAAKLSQLHEGPFPS